MLKFPIPFSLFSLLLMLCLTGCSNNVNVKGKVIYEDDKSPVTSGLINFETASFRAKGTIKSDGSYVIGSEKVADGLPPGKYKVTIISYAKSDNPRAAPTLAVAQLYSSMATTPLEVEVTKSTVQDFEVKRP